MYSKEIVDNFHTRYIPEPNTGCWLWMGSLDGKKYGMLQINGKMKKTHRFSWEIAHGKIPKGIHVLHKCDTPTCCNPDHLFLGTNQDNVDDKMQKRRHWTFSKTHCSEGHELTPENTRIRKHDNSRCCRICERRRCSEFYKKKIKQDPLWNIKRHARRKGV